MSKAIKTVKISYEPSRGVIDLLRKFRRMVDYCMRIGLERGVTSKYGLTKEVYDDLKSFKLHSWYSLYAISAATSILKNYRKRKRKGKKVRKPRARKLFAEIGRQGFKINKNELKIAIRPREHFRVPLHKRVEEFLKVAKPKCIYITPSSIDVTFEKEVEIKGPRNWIALDVNEKLVVGAYIEKGKLRVLSFDMEEIGEARHNFFERMREAQEKYGRDERVLRKILSEWGRNLNNRVDSRLHGVSSKIVKLCKVKDLGIILEDLKGIRNSINSMTKGFNLPSGKVQGISRKSRRLKRRLNSWPFRKLQYSIEYKARWEGVKVVYADPRNTSRVCAVCGCKAKDPKAQVLECCCLNRHVNACLNLLRTQDEGLRFVPDRLPSVAMRQGCLELLDESDISPTGFASITTRGRIWD